MKAGKTLVLLAAVALSGALAPGAQAAKAVHVSCGETITADTKLANDLTDCPGNGIVIGASGITLDLNGHTVDGTGRQESCPDHPLCIGIDNRAGHPGFTVQDGTVQEFEVGIVGDGGRDQRVRRLAVLRNGDGIVLFRAADSEATGNSLEENVFGIFAGRSEDIRIARNSVSGFAELGGCGIEVSRSERVLVAGNDVFASDPGAAIAGETCGICVCFGSADTQVERNSVSGNGFVGVLLEGDDNSVTGNQVLRNGIGVILVGDRNSVTRNQVVDTGDGCDKNCGPGISFEGGRGNLIANNTVERTRGGPGIQLAAFEPATPPAIGNTARSNVVRDGSFDGILVESTASETLLERNTVSDNEDDGIDVQSEATTLTRNTANDNFDLGIEAVPGVVDGGGNKASGNRNPLQCTNVFCS